MAKRCPVCAAPFKDDASLGAHLAVCLQTHGTGARRKVEAGAAGAEKSHGDPDEERGRVLCYVCGQRVLSAGSLRLHLNKCERLALAARRLDEEAGAPRSSLPVAPKVAVPTAESDAAEIRAWNAAARIAFTESLPRCPHCDRRFAAAAARDAHAARCRGAPPTKARPAGAGEVFDERTSASAVGTKAWGGEQTDRPTHVFAFDVDPSVAACLARGRKRVIQRRFNVGVLEAIPERKAPAL